MLGGGITVGAGQDEHPVRPMSQRGPNLLAGDQPIFPIGPGPGGHVGQVRAGVGFAVALGPKRGPGHDAGQKPGLLVGGAEGHDRGTGQAFTDVAEAPRASGPGVLLVPDHLLVKAEPPAPVFGGPPDAGPAVGAQVLLPRQTFLEQGMLVAWSASASHPGKIAVELLGQPPPGFGPEFLVLIGEPQIHSRERNAHLTERQISAFAP